MQVCWGFWPASIKTIDTESHPTGQKKRLETLSLLRLTVRFVAQVSLPCVPIPLAHRLGQLRSKRSTQRAIQQGKRSDLKPYIFTSSTSCPRCPCTGLSISKSDALSQFPCCFSLHCGECHHRSPKGNLAASSVHASSQHYWCPP